MTAPVPVPRGRAGRSAGPHPLRARRASGPEIIEAADHALQVLMMVRRNGVLRVSGVAAELGVSASTAHRLLATLRARNFVVQHSDRSYRPGPALEAVSRELSPTARLAQIARPALRALRNETHETVSVMVLVGQHIHVIEVLVSPLALRVAEPPGPIVVPARLAAGGKVLLAELGRREIEQVLPELRTDPLAMQRLLKDLAETRRRGYGSNLGESDPEVSALSMPVRPPGGRACAAMSVVVPTERFRSWDLARLHAALRSAVRTVEAQL